MRYHTREVYSTLGSDTDRPHWAGVCFFIHYYPHEAPPPAYVPHVGNQNKERRRAGLDAFFPGCPGLKCLNR